MKTVQGLEFRDFGACNTTTAAANNNNNKNREE